MSHSEHELAVCFLDVIEHDVVPLTRAGVERGDKVFGAAVLRKSDLSLVIAGTNRETENPLFHGEVATYGARVAGIRSTVEGEVQRLTPQHAARIQELEERYADPLPELERRVGDFGAKVEGHLKRMGLSP